MPFPFDKYPWLNFHELNLAYFIKHFREIFQQWNSLLNEMYEWKDATDAELAEWKSTVEAGITSWETGLQQSMDNWKNQTEADISTWEATTLAALDAWKTATAVIFEQIRTEAAASAQAAANSATSAQSALAGAQTAQAAAEAAAAGIQSELIQIQQNTAGIDSLKESLNYNKTATPGYILRATNEGNGCEWSLVGTPTDQQAEAAISAWLTAHPEATTTVQDGSITEVKLNPALKNKVNAIVPITLYEHLVLNNDWTSAVQTAINENNCILINKDINIEGTVSIPARKTILIDSITITKTLNSGNTSPVFYLGAQYSSLIGKGSNSRIISQCDSPDGIIKIGSPTNTTATKNVTYCFVSDLYIQGKANEGDNMGVHLCGTTAPGFVSYFHRINNLTISTVALGIVFNNAANGNIVTNIEFLYCGYNTTTGAFCFIRTQGDYNIGRVPLENVIVNAFHHQSTNATTIYLGTAIGLNRIDNIICEQGGTSAHACYVDPNEPVLSESSANVIKFTYNTSYSITASDEFLQRNVIETHKLLRIPSIVCKDATIREALTVAGHEIRSNGKTVYDFESITNLTKNTNFIIGTFGKFSTSTHINRSCIVDLTGVTSFTSGNNNMTECSTQKYRIIYDANTYTIEELTTKIGTLELSINTTGELVLHTKSHSGGSSTRIGAKILVEMYGYIPPEPFNFTDTTNFARIN